MQWENSTKIIFKVALVIIGAAFLWLIRDIIMLLLISLIIASAMEPMVDYFSERNVPRAVSVLTVYIMVLGFIALVLYLLIPPAIDQLQILAGKWPEYFSQFQQRFGAVSFSGSSIADFWTNYISGEGGLLSHTFGVFNGFVSFITVLVISFYLVAEEKGMKQFVSTLLPEKHHNFTMGLLEKIQRKMGLWILGQVILSFSIFILTFIGLLIIGLLFKEQGGNPILSNALILALLAGLLEVVPYIGPFLSAVPSIVIAFIFSPPLALIVALLYLVIQKTEGYVLVPKIMQKTVGTSPLVVLLALLIGFKLAGILGLLVAVPIASAVTVVVKELEALKPA